MVIDIGCGTGKVTMIEIAKKAYAVDVRNEVMEASRANLAAWSGSNVELRQQDGLDLLKGCDHSVVRSSAGSGIWMRCWLCSRTASQAA